MKTPALKAVNQQLLAATPAASSHPRKAPGQLIQRSLDLHLWAMPHREALVRTGFDIALLDSLPLRAQACLEAQTLWNVARKKPAPDRAELPRLEAMAKTLRAEIREGLSFLAVKHGKPVRAYLPKPVRKKTRDIRYQHFRAHAIRAREYQEDLISIGLAPDVIEQACTLADRLDRANAAIGLDLTVKKTLDLRNRAFVFLGQADRAVRQAGRFAFRNDPERRRGFR